MDENNVYSIDKEQLVRVDMVDVNRLQDGANEKVLFNENFLVHPIVFK